MWRMMGKLINETVNLVCIGKNKLQTYKCIVNFTVQRSHFVLEIDKTITNLVCGDCMPSCNT